MKVNDQHDKSGGCSCEFCVPSFVALDIEPVFPVTIQSRATEQAVVAKAIADAPRANAPALPQPVLRRIGPFVVEDRQVLTAQ